jgi:ribosome production factor 1
VISCFSEGIGKRAVTILHLSPLICFLGNWFRYMFKSAEKTALQEIGPRFTLKLRYIKKGVPAVGQLGAAPPPLMFDDGEEVVNPADLSDEAQYQRDTAMAQKSAPAKDEEYIWQRKVCCLVFDTYSVDLLT